MNQAVSFGYGGNPNLSRQYQQHQLTQDQVLEYMRCADPITGPLYFIENYVRIVNVDEGLVPFEPYDFQKEMITTIHNNRFTICKLPRQVGKSTTSIAYILWYILFNEDAKVALLAHKGAMARELLDRLRLAYEWIPKWMQMGIVNWNKGFIELANRSSVLAESTTSGSVRGRTFNLVMLDEFAFVQNNLAVEFFQSTFPTISSGKNTKVVITSTPNGMNLFYKMWKESQEKKNDYVPVEVNWFDVPGRDEKFKETMIRNTSQEQWEQEFECHFLGSTHTLISGAKLRALSWNDPVAKNYVDEYGALDIFIQPEKNHTYVLTCDVSRGQGLDAQAFSVIDVTETPYRQVAKYRNNRMSAIVYPNIIQQTAMMYNEAFVLVEINDIGQQVVDILHYDLSYDNLIKMNMKGKQGQQVSTGHKKQIQFGVRTTTPVKRIGCTNLKTLVERDKLIIYDYDTVNELTTFIVTKESYAAEEGCHDDLAMSLVLFGWLANQRVFKEAIGSNIRTLLEREQMELLDENFVPFGQMSDGHAENSSSDDEGNVWFDIGEIKGKYGYDPNFRL